MPFAAFAVVTLVVTGPRPVVDTLPYRTEEVSYTSAGLTLHASLMLPPGPGPRAAVVILHGSGKSDRSNPWTKAYADALARRGVIVLYPDKRGSGTSAGDWRTASIEDLAADGSAALALLRKRPEVDTTRTGVIGFSQGGYVAAVLAAQDSSCRYAISISGGTASMLQQTVDEAESDAGAAGLTLTAAERAGLLRLHQVAFDRALGKVSWSRYQAGIADQLRATPRLRPVTETFPADSLHPIWGWIGRVGSFDPMTYWERVRRPALFIYGGKDARVRVDQSIDRITATRAPIATSAVILRFQGNAHAACREDELDFIARWIADRGAN